jgi:hypothetical protein
MATIGRSSLEWSAVEIRSLSRKFPVGREALEAVVEGYPLRINPHFMSLIQSVGDTKGLRATPRMRRSPPPPPVKACRKRLSSLLLPASSTGIRTGRFSGFPAVRRPLPVSFWKTPARYWSRSAQVRFYRRPGRHSREPVLRGGDPFRRRSPHAFRRTDRGYPGASETHHPR